MISNEFFNKYNVSLNEQQMDAVQSVDGPVLLLAVPGSGKTTVLVTRLGYMIMLQYPFEKNSDFDIYKGSNKRYV